MIQMNMLWFCIRPWSDFAWYRLIGSLLGTLDWNHHEVILSPFVWHLETQSGPLTHIRNTQHLCVLGCNLLLKYLSTMSHMTFDVRQITRLSFKPIDVKHNIHHSKSWWELVEVCEDLGPALNPLHNSIIWVWQPHPKLSFGIFEHKDYMQVNSLFVGSYWWLKDNFSTSQHVVDFGHQLYYIILYYMKVLITCASKCI
jgi:hypothetical protein